MKNSTPPPPNDRLALQLQATAEEIRGVLGKVTRWMTAADLPAADCDTAELVLAELLNNIAEHAYAGLPPGAVDIQLERLTKAIKVLLSDHGRSMPDGRLPGGALPDANVPLEDLPEGGFGWFLIFTLTENLSYIRSGDRNMLRFELPVGRNE